MDWNKFWELFHKAWGQANGSPEYNKSMWKELHHMLLDQERKERQFVSSIFDGIHTPKE